MPVQVAFAFTINTSQGQTFKRVGVGVCGVVCWCVVYGCRVGGMCVGCGLCVGWGFYVLLYGFTCVCENVGVDVLAYDVWCVDIKGGSG